MKIKLLLFFLVFCTTVAISQPPSYIMPSPQVNAFLKFRDYPVDLSTGLVDITVPLLSLDLRSYQLPISAKFHASGRKIDFSYSELGLNWKLESFGIITREIRGELDSYASADLMEKPGSYLITYPGEPAGDRTDKYERRLRIAGTEGYMPVADTEYDIFTISFRGISSSFIIRDGSPVFLDYVPYKVHYSGDNFIITDDKGIEYQFGIFVEDGVRYGSTLSYFQTPGTMSWFLGKITTPEQESIRFKYNQVSTNQLQIRGNISFGAVARLGDYAYQEGFDQGENGFSQLSGVLGYDVKNVITSDDYPLIYLTDIESARGKLEFRYNTPTYSLDEIVLSSNDDTAVKKVKFAYRDIANSSSIVIPNNQGRTIDNIKLIDAAKPQNYSQYKMEYYEGSIPNDLSEYGFGKDFWGYANSNRYFNNIPVNQVVEKVGPPTYISNYTRTIGSTDRREPDYSQKLIGMLKKLTIPTGGSSEFVYESNRYEANNGLNYQGPGLRIEQIKNFDGTRYITKKYKYGLNENGLGSLFRKPSEQDFQTTKLITNVPGLNGVGWSHALQPIIINALRYRYREFFTDPIAYIRPAYSLPVYYSLVTEYQADSQDNKLGKTTYVFDTPLHESERKDFYDSPTDDYFTFVKFIPHYYSKYRLTSKTDYSFSDNVFSEVKKMNYFYTKKRETKIMQSTFYRRHEVHSARSYSSHNLDEEYIETQFTSSTQPPIGFEFPWNTIAIRDYMLVSATFLLDSVSEIDYSATGAIKKTTSYIYGSPYTISPSSIIEKSSTGIVKEKKMYYPEDVLSLQGLSGGDLSTQDYQGLEGVKKANGHFSSIPIQTEMYSNGILSQIQRSSFKMSNGKPYLYKNQIKYDPSQDFSTEYEITSFSNSGLPLELKLKGLQSQSYIWSNRGQYVTAKAVNAQPSDIAFNGFESEDTGNWSWNGQVTTGNAYSGTRYLLFTANGGSISKNGLNPVVKYSVTMWCSASGNVPGDGFLAVKSSNQWTLYEKVITGVTAFSYSSTNCLIDDIAICPLNAQITTFTYKPLVGMTSQTDGKGLSTFYEYDDFQRLKSIKDQNGNIVQSFDYHFRPQN